MSDWGYFIDIDQIYTEKYITIKKPINNEKLMTQNMINSYVYDESYSHENNYILFEFVNYCFQTLSRIFSIKSRIN